jgi:hypothetical protein
MKIYLFIISLLFCGITYSQTSISGSVKDKKNQPIPGANIKVIGDSAGTVTDIDGNFTLSTSKKPPLVLEVSSIGFATKRANITSNNQSVSVVLTDEENKLDEIVISASRTPERVLESPVTIERVNLSSIRSAPSANYYDLVGNLKGVDLITSSLTFKTVTTRGFGYSGNTRFNQISKSMDKSTRSLTIIKSMHS